MKKNHLCINENIFTLEKKLSFIQNLQLILLNFFIIAFMLLLFINF